MLFEKLTINCKTDLVASVDFSIKNFLEFIDETKNIKLEESELLVSFGVTLLFSSIYL